MRARQLISVVCLGLGVAGLALATVPQLEPTFTAAQIEAGAPALEWTRNADGSESAVISEKDGGLDLKGVKITRRESGDDDRAEVLFTLETGRTHQIRVHCAAAGHALVGDNLYGTPGPPSRHFLHAWQLHLTHPLTGRELVIKAPLPEDMRAAISRLIRPGGRR